MKFNKQRIDEIFKCYSVNGLTVDGQTQLLFAGEGPGICKLFAGSDFGQDQVLWDDGANEGGTMSIVSVPDYEGYFFTSTGFFSMVDSGDSKIYLVRYQAGQFIKKEIVRIPYLHRFSVLTVEDHRYLVACSLHGGKVDKEDWTKAGKIYVAELPMDLDSEFEVELRVYQDGLIKNHGFSEFEDKGKKGVLVASESGVLAVYPPQAGQSEWTKRQILDFPASDAAAIDMDGDGELEYAVLSPFHGDQFNVYKQVDGQYVSVYKYPKHLDFYHAIWADLFNGVPSMVIGARKEDMDLYLVQYDSVKQAYVSHLIESGAGSSNARILHTEKGDIILSANRQINEAAIYYC